MTYHITPVLSASAPLKTCQAVSFWQTVTYVPVTKISTSTCYSLRGFFLVSGPVLENKIIFNSVYSFDTVKH